MSPPPVSKANANGVKADGMVLVEYTGTAENTHRVVGRKSGTAYRFGNTDSHRQKYVYKDDVPFLESLRHYKVVAPIVSAPSASPLIIRERQIA